MKRRMFVFHRERCFGCHGCVAACASTHGLEPALQYRALHKLPPADGRSETRFLSLACNHCAKAPCVKACPSGAMHHDRILGLVSIDPARCLGCRYCQMACPYDAIRWDARAGVVRKCDFCAARLAESKAPACVATCFSGALEHRWEEVDEEPPGCQRAAPGFTHHPSIRPMIRFTTSVVRPGDGEDAP